MVRAGHSARPGARAAKLGCPLGGCLQPVNVPACVQPSQPAGLGTPFCISAPPLGPQAHSLALVCPPVKWETHTTLLMWKNLVHSRDVIILVSSFPF